MKESPEVSIQSGNDKREKHHRRSIRLKGYNYSQEGAYFVTICTQNRKCILVNVTDTCLNLYQFGEIVRSVWVDLPLHYKYVRLDVFAIMPNHVHGILFLVGAGLKPAPTKYPLSEIIRGFKTFSARLINELRKVSGVSVWQRNYYERIIRNEDELNRIREYVMYNPLQWQFDRENPNKNENTFYESQWKWLEGE